MAEDFRAVIRVELDSGTLNTVKSDIEKIKLNPIKISLDTKDFDKQIEKISKQLKEIKPPTVPLKISSNNSSSKSIVSSSVKSQISEYKQLKDLVDKINNSKTRIGDLEIKGGSQEQIKSLTADLEKLQTEYNELRTVLSGQLSDEQLFKLDESIDKTVRKIDEAKAKTRDGIISKIDDGTIDEQINKIENGFNKLKDKSDGTAKSISELKVAAKNFDKTADTDTVIREYNELEKQIKETAQAVDGLSQKQKEGNRESLFGRRKAKLNLDIETWLNKNTSASGALVSQIKKIQSEINAADKTTFNNLEAQFKGLTREAQATGQVGLSTIDRLKKQFSNLGVYMSAAAVISRITSALRDMYNVVVKVDDALTELKKVSGASDAQLNITFENSKQNAKEYASSLSDMINATADWSRMGYSLPEAEELAKVSTLYKNVGDNIDIDTANNSLISTLQGFSDELEAKDAESVIDKFNEVANNYAIDSAGIGEALQRSAATFNAANTGLSKSIALITGTKQNWFDIWKHIFEDIFNCWKILRVL